MFPLIFHLFGTRMHIHIYTRKHTCIHVYMDIFIHYTHTHTHTHIHSTYKCMALLSMLHQVARNRLDHEMYHPELLIPV